MSAPDLQALASARFKDLTPAEAELLRAVRTPDFAVCGPNLSPSDPENDSSKGDMWRDTRRIRADLIRWLCMDPQARSFIDPEGIEIFGARIRGDLDLSNLTIPFPLAMQHCRIAGTLDLTLTHLIELNLGGTSVRLLAANGICTAGSAFFRHGFSTDVNLKIMGGQIGGNFECDGGIFRNGINADAVKVSGSLFLRKGFVSHGEVRLVGAAVDGNLECDEGAFENHTKPVADPKVRALNLDNIVVKGDVYLRKGFSARGDVSLIGAQIGGDLDCSETRIIGELNLARCTVRGAFFWRSIPNPNLIRLDLRNAAVYAIQDESSSWPNQGNLRLEGFSYVTIMDPKSGVEDRLEWLAREQPFTPQPYRQLAKVYSNLGNEDAAHKVLMQMQRRQRAEHWYQQPESWLLRWSIGYGYHPLYAFWELAALAGLGWIIYRRAYLNGAMTPTDKEAYAAFDPKVHTTTLPNYPRFSPLVYSVENSLPLVNLGQTERWQPDPANIPTDFGPLFARLKRTALPLVSKASWRAAISQLRSLLTSPRLLWRRVKNMNPSPLFVQRFLWFQIILGWILATLFAAGVTGVIRKD